MEKPFDITFDFPIDHSDISIPLKATAELHHSDPYYVVNNFHYAGVDTGKKLISILPTLEIKLVEKEGRHTWVHRDSDRESLLSIAIGRAIEKNGG